MHLGHAMLKRNEAVPPIRQPLDNIVQDNKNEKHDYEDKPDLHDDLFDLHAEIPTEQTLKAKNHDVSSVKHRDGKQVDDTQLKADEGDPPNQGHESHLERFVG